MEAVGWIVSTGMSIHQANQLDPELHRLQTTLHQARCLIDRGEWGTFVDKKLAPLLSQLKDSTYDAEDLLRQLQDKDLQQKLENAGQSRPGQFFSSSMNAIKAFLDGKKGSLKETEDKLDKDIAVVEKLLDSMGLANHPLQYMPETSSTLQDPEVFGRDTERDALMKTMGVTVGRDEKRDQVIQQLLGVPRTGRGSRSIVSTGKRAAAASRDAASTSSGKRPKANRSCTSNERAAAVSSISHTSNVSVLPIVGIGGVGKTTLAQFIYNDPRVKRHFSTRIWVCVSDLFDKKRLTKEIIESISRKDFSSLSSLNSLQEILIGRLESETFLLVLDDIWPIPNAEWESFFGPLRHGQEGSMILVTTRSQDVADLVFTSNCKPVHLEGLPSDVFWEFFKKCAFGTKDPKSYPHLQNIAQNISLKLCGSPLAAKTLGRLLSMNFSYDHWRYIQDSKLLALNQRKHELLPALQLSYLYLPPHLRRCFAFCSMFPKDYSFKRDEIVDIWVAEGFVASTDNNNIRIEDVGIGYLDELRSRFLFQTDPRNPDKKYICNA